LPGLGPLLHDNAEKVRTTFVELLESVKAVKSIRFYDIVPIEHLLTRLAIDKMLGKRITSLLLNSYFPYNKESSEQMKRCLVLLQANTAAAINFYSYVPALAPIGNVAKFIGTLQKYLSKCIQRGDEDKENGNKL
jgi:condensin-2 complex subunit G2